MAIFIAPLILIGCGEPEGTARGFTTPEITVLDLGDRQHRLLDYMGQVLVLNFWSSGCGPCIVEMPHLDSLYQQYGKDGLVVLGINQGEEPKAVASTVKRLGVSYPIAIDQLGITAKRYNVIGVPATFILDREGVLRDKVMGEVSRARLEAMLAPLLGQATAASPQAINDTKTAFINELAANSQTSVNDPQVTDPQAIVQEQETSTMDQVAPTKERAGNNGDAVAGGELYRGVCRDCHGRNANLRALGRSEPLRELSAEQILETLKQYQHASPKTPQAVPKSGLSDQDIQDLVAYLQDLKGEP